MNVMLRTEQHLEFLSLKGGYTCWSESIYFKMLHCWKSRFKCGYPAKAGAQKDSHFNFHFHIHKLETDY